MAGNEVSLVDVVRGLDGLITEAQMADGDTAGLFGVILEVCLYIFIGMVADDLDRVFVCAYGTVAAQTPELALDGAFCGSVGSGLLLEGEVGNVIYDTDGEVVARILLSQLVVYSEYAGGRSILGA